MPYETIKDVNIYYEIHGPSEAPPLVCIEGWGYSLWMWFRQIPVFKKRYKCIIFDNRGVGKSSKPDYPYTMKMFADDTFGLMKALDITNAHILGISMGGYIGQQIAISYPEKVRSLILASTSFGGPNAILANDKTMASMFAIPTETLSKEQAMAMRYSVIFSSQFIQKNELLIKQIQKWRDQNPQPLYARGHQASASLGFNAEAEVKQISSPTLILQGDSDLVMPPKNAEMLADRISTSKLTLIKGGPHLSFIEYYDKFNNAVMNFIDEVENGTFSSEPKRLVI
ncbi:MAG: alpha/beta fold hydrolase [Promethearchaeota archaeon]